MSQPTPRSDVEVRAVLSTVARCGQVLDLFTRARPEWGVTDIAHELGMPKSNAHEILSSLAAIDLLQRTGTSRYRLGWRVMSMATGVVDADSLRRHAPPIMEMLAREIGETVHLAVWDGRRLVFLTRVLAAGGVDQDHARSGSSIPAYCTASGKVLLADLPWTEVVRRVGREGLVAWTSHTVTDLDRLRRELDATRTLGLGVNDQEADLGICGMAAPVTGEDGTVIAALGLSLPAGHLAEVRRRHARLLQRMAGRLSTLVTADARDPSLHPPNRWDVQPDTPRTAHA